MRVVVRDASFLKRIEGVLILGSFKKEKLPGWTKSLPGGIEELISRTVKEDMFEWESDKILSIRGQKNSRVRTILLIGLGEKSEWNEEKARRAAGISRTSLSSSRHQKASMLIFGSEADPAIAKAQTEGFILSGYKFDKYKTKDNRDDGAGEFGSLELIAPWGKVNSDLKKAVKNGAIISESVMFTRDLQAEPANTATPSFLAAKARKIASSSPKIRVKVFDRAKIKKLKMGALIGVSKGSIEPPKFIILEYRGASAGRKPIALVGKGITFDSGGISIKPSAGMEEMKYDMSGAAAVLGVFKALVQINVKGNVVGIIPATENLLGGSAQKPGDIVKTYSGKTIEVINTDAEGRLVLADALAYVVRNYNPSAIVDLATLTGAVVVALGTHATGLVSNNSELTKKLIDAGESTGERVWELPLWDEFRDQIKSDIADMKNIGGREGGTITAAALLEKFVGETPWVHLDIAGTAYISKPLPYSPKGPTGVGVRLLMEFLK